MPGRPWRRGLAVCLAGLLCGTVLQAQPPAECADGRISHIFVDNHSIFDLAERGGDERLLWAYRLANRLHVRTAPDVIRRELLFDVGDCYDLELLRESERVLRAATFIADVDIFAIRQADGSYHVIVDTRDEWSFRLEPQLEREDLPGVVGVAASEANLLGTGGHLSLFYLRRHDAPHYGISYATPQLFRTRWDAGIAYARTAVGHAVAQSVTYPFVGESGRWAFREQVLYEDRYFEFYTRSEGSLLTVLFPERRMAFDVGVVGRSGERGRLTLLGAGVAAERISYPDRPIAVFSGHRRVPPEAAAIDTAELRVDAVASTRALVLIGQRNVRFARRRALDTVNGTEDVRIGAEIEAVLGHTLPLLSRDRGVSVDLGLFAAAEPWDGLYAGSRVFVEARRDTDTPVEREEWSDIRMQANAWMYWRPRHDARQLVVGSVAAAGGWNSRVPFQITLGGASGLRGFRRHVDPGAQRVTVSLEHRSYLAWPLPELFDLGSVVYLDAGRVWAGEAPFAHDSPYRASLGVGLRAALPPGSRQMVQLDVAAPLQRDIGWRDVLLRVSFGPATGPRVVHDDPQLRRSSRRGLTASVFNFPH